MMLKFTGVTAPVDGGRELEDLGFELKRGECMALHGPSPARTVFADLLLGLRDPDAGRVHCLDSAWTTLSPTARRSVRRRIGCALDRESFVSNLDVMENLTLVERMHGGRGAEAIAAEAAALAQRLHFDPIPDVRPHVVQRASLHRFAILRALLGARELLILEEVPQALAANSATALIGELERRRRDGTAVVWLGDGTPPDRLSPTL